MIKLLESIFGKAPPSSTRLDATLVRKATDRLVDGTDPRMRGVSGYYDKLRPAVECSVEYAIDLVDSISDPALIARANYLSDPRLRAFFSSVEHIREVLSSSQDISSFLRARGRTPIEPIHALFVVMHKEQKTLGMQLQGDVVRRDVVQHVYNFEGHKFVSPNMDEEQYRWELKRKAYDELISAALARLVSLREERTTAQKNQQLLKAKLRRLRAGSLGLAPAIEGLPQQDTGTVEQEVARIEKELEEITIGTTTLSDYVDVCVETLNSPESQLRIRPIEITLDQMGRKVEAGSSPSARTLSLQEVSVSDGRSAIIMMAQINPEELPPLKSFTKEARKYLY